MYLSINADFISYLIIYHGQKLEAQMQISGK